MATTLAPDSPRNAKQQADSPRNGQSAPWSAPSISLPKGGGAIRGIGEKFAANPVTGTGTMTVPLATSPGRSGFGPQLSLSYDSGAGNGPFGIGWSLSLPAITRKTDKGLPQYLEADESDVFLLSGSEDLVPVLAMQNGTWVRWSDERTVVGDAYVVHRYRPRIEGLFARIERWTRTHDGDTHWRSISKDNITTFYGKTSESRVADPQDLRRVFGWLIWRGYNAAAWAFTISAFCLWLFVGAENTTHGRFKVPWPVGRGDRPPPSAWRTSRQTDRGCRE